MMKKILCTLASILLLINTLSAQNLNLEIWEIQGEELFTHYLNQFVETNENIVQQLEMITFSSKHRLIDLIITKQHLME